MAEIEQRTRQRGFDAGRKVLGRRQHIAVDMDGRLVVERKPKADRKVPSPAARADPRMRPKG